MLREDGFVRRWAFICDHERTYESNSNKDTGSKRTHCPFFVNTSCLKNKNPDISVFINKIVDKHNHELNLNKNNGFKRTHYSFLINISYLKNKNSDTLVFVNKIVNKYNHKLNKDRIKFEESKKFTSEMMDDIKFMTISCKFGVTAQRKFLESKFSLHPIYSKDLYAAINKFRLTCKSLSNDAAKISNWLDEQKESDS